MRHINNKCIRAFGLCAIIGAAAGCTTTDLNANKLTNAVKSASFPEPQLHLRKVKDDERQTVERWLKDGIEMIQSDRFFDNLAQVSDAYSEVWVSQERGAATPSDITKLLKLSTQDISDVNWAKTSVNLQGKAKRANTGIGYNDRKRNTRATVGKTGVGGKMTFGRVHLDRYINGDTVEKSCAMNTLTHEISHTLSETANKLDWVFIDEEGDTDRPGNMLKASYFIGVVAQCTYLQNVGRVAENDLDACMKTFADPELKFQFQTIACDEFPDQDAVTPAGRGYTPRRWDE